ncbi:PorV/PorQ family protein [candidate division KSB1 bacterium]|nr:PorV/PorQ family protein [candidate division KSB1 bacterium]
MKEKRIQILTMLLIIGWLQIPVSLYANKPYRVGTTTANFLEIGYGAAGIAMGDAYVSQVQDISAVYWNPAGLAFMKNNQTMFMAQPWLVDVNTSYVAVGVPVSNLGTFALNVIHIGYGEMEVTTLSQQEGTGEMFDANEFAAALSYGRAITDWFAFGASVKYVSSQIWHETGSAIAFDLGVIIKTEFLSPSGRQTDGMRIGMSISNYGTKLRYDGIDLLNPIDIEPGENGNFRDVPGQFRLSSWELPLIFRIGVSMQPIRMGNQSITFAANALHPNNNSESVNLGLEYAVNIPAFGKLFFRGGYKALFMESSEYGLTLGAGFAMNLPKNTGIRCDYAYRNLGVLGSANCFGIGFEF